MSDETEEERYHRLAKEHNLIDGAVDALHGFDEELKKRDNVYDRAAADAMREIGFTEKEITDRFGYSPAPFEDVTDEVSDPLCSP
jgi:hypothetical protein